MTVRVLVCEDDVLILLNTVDILEEMGYSVLEAANAAEALAALETGGVDVLLTDIGLPDMSGLDLALTAVQRHPGLAVIFATGQMSVPGSEAIARAQVLCKPYDMRDLEKVLQKAVSPSD